MRVCEILTMEDFEQGQRLAGRIYMQDGKLVADPKTDSEDLMDSILQELDEEENPEEALEELPERYSGIALRARFVERNIRNWDPDSTEVVEEDS